VALGSEKEAVNVCRMPSCRETVGTERRGAPLFEEAFANLECRVVGKMEAGDHTVYLGEVAAAHLGRPADILTDLDTSMEYGG
jgi:flavin reductase (DIM6/NTAB) family NADH-FMN oxidoreductase RutF